MGVTDDRRGQDEMVRRLQALAALEVRVGVLQPEPTKDGESTITTAAAAHEFGTATIPQRSFIGRTVDEGKQAIVDLQTRAAQRVLDGAAPEQAAGEVGIVVAGMVRKTISSNVPPALKPATIAAKGGNTHTLIETGQLQRSIASEVVSRGGAG